MGHLRCVAGFGVRGLDGVVFVLTISEEAMDLVSNVCRKQCCLLAKRFSSCMRGHGNFELCAICVPNVYSDI